MQDSEKPEVPTDQSHDHQVFQRKDNEKTNQNGTFVIGQPTGQTSTEADQKNKIGGYGYYAVSTEALEAPQATYIASLAC